MTIGPLKWEDIEANMIEFNRGLHTPSIASKRFSNYFHWYYHPGLDIFGPSKFIGYPGTTHENYKGHGDGGLTQRLLSEYFDRVAPEEYEYYLNKLIEVADVYGYKVSKKTLEGNPGWIYKPKREVMEQFIDTDPAYDVMLDDEEAFLYKEGLSKSVVVNKYERDPKIKKAAILIHGTTCMVCKFNFEEFYGAHGKGFIEIHHIRPLSSIKKEHIVDPKEDIAVLCANCHRMIHHKRSEPLTIEELTSIVQRNK